jgi:uncharacterized protein YecT (DUF1311 family)
MMITQLELNRRALVESEKAEAELNSVLNMLRELFHDWPDRLNALEASQVAFETYCDAQMELIHGVNEAGSIGPMVRWRERAYLLRERTAHLKALLNDFSNHSSASSAKVS